MSESKYFYLDECEDAIIRATVAIEVYKWLKQQPETTPDKLAEQSGRVIENIHCATRMLQSHIQEQPKHKLIKMYQEDVIELQLLWNQVPK